jgi:hypothetical protein
MTARCKDLGDVQQLLKNALIFFSSQPKESKVEII